MKFKILPVESFLNLVQGVSMYDLVVGYNPHHPTMGSAWPWCQAWPGTGTGTHMHRLRKIWEMYLRNFLNMKGIVNKEKGIYASHVLGSQEESVYTGLLYPRWHTMPTMPQWWIYAQFFPTDLFYLRDFLIYHMKIEHRCTQT